MRDNKRINAEVKLACDVYGSKNVLWAPDGSWIKIANFSLPPNLNMKNTDIIVIFPEKYGYGAALRDCFVNPDLKAWKQIRNQWEEIPHYFQEYPYATLQLGSKREFVNKKWRYLCIHEKNWHPKKSNIITFLQYVTLSGTGKTFSNPTSKGDSRDMEDKVNLTFKEDDFVEFRGQLLKRDGLERQSYCLTGVAEREGNLEILVHKMIHPSDEDYRVQHRFLVDTKPEFLLRVFSEFERSELKGFLHAHSHPFTARAVFSGGDNRHLVGEIKSVRDHLSLSSKSGDFYFIRLVCGKSEGGFTGEVYTPSLDRCGNIEEIKVVGRSGVRKYYRCSYLGESHGEMLPHDLERWDRHIRWLGEEGQKKISDTHLVVCGVGGIGSVIVANAKGLGFKEITLIDPDKVELSNLNRLIGAEREDVGKLKVDVMSREVRKIDPSAVIHILPCKVEEEEAHRAIIGGDVIISGLDNLSSRFEVQILAARYLKPLLDIGSGISLKGDRKTVADMGGQVVLYYPGGPCLACQGIPILEATSGLSEEIRRTVGYVRGTDITPPAVITINSVLGGAGMNTLVKYLVGFPLNSTHTKYDLLTESIHHFNFGKKEECPICGRQGLEGRGDEFVEILPCEQMDIENPLSEELNLQKEGP